MEKFHLNFVENRLVYEETPKPGTEGAEAAPATPQNPDDVNKGAAERGVDAVNKSPVDTSTKAEAVDRVLTPEEKERMRQAAETADTGINAAVDPGLVEGVSSVQESGANTATMTVAPQAPAGGVAPLTEEQFNASSVGSAGEMPPVQETTANTAPITVAPSAPQEPDTHSADSSGQEVQRPNDIQSAAAEAGAITIPSEDKSATVPVETSAAPADTIAERQAAMAGPGQAPQPSGEVSEAHRAVVESTQKEAENPAPAAVSPDLSGDKELHPERDEQPAFEDKELHPERDEAPAAQPEDSTETTPDLSGDKELHPERDEKSNDSKLPEEKKDDEGPDLSGRKFDPKDEQYVKDAQTVMQKFIEENKDAMGLPKDFNGLGEKGVDGKYGPASQEVATKIQEYLVKNKIVPEQGEDGKQFADGKMGPKTFEAIQKYAQAKEQDKTIEKNLSGISGVDMAKMSTEDKANLRSYIVDKAGFDDKDTPESKSAKIDAVISQSLNIYGGDGSQILKQAQEFATKKEEESAAKNPQEEEKTSDKGKEKSDAEKEKEWKVIKEKMDQVTPAQIEEFESKLSPGLKEAIDKGENMQINGEPATKEDFYKLMIAQGTDAKDTSKKFEAAIKDAQAKPSEKPEGKSTEEPTQKPAENPTASEEPKPETEKEKKEALAKELLGYTQEAILKMEKEDPTKAEEFRKFMGDENYQAMKDGRMPTKEISSKTQGESEVRRPRDKAEKKPAYTPEVKAFRNEAVPLEARKIMKQNILAEHPEAAGNVKAQNRILDAKWAELYQQANTDPKAFSQEYIRLATANGTAPIVPQPGSEMGRPMTRAEYAMAVANASEQVRFNNYMRNQAIYNGAPYVPFGGGGINISYTKIESKGDHDHNYSHRGYRGRRR